MKKVVVRIKDYGISIDAKNQIVQSEDLTFEGKEIGVLNNDKGLLIISEQDKDSEPDRMRPIQWRELAVFNKDQWIYWKRLK